jgi:CheY-like chemotaxis protein
MPRGGELFLELKNIDLDDSHISTHLGAAPGPYVMLAVTDTGVGMAPEVQRQIFEPFFTTKPVGEGTGLGLATVHGIVNQSGGTIWVYSEPGHGTTFKVYLPRIADAADAPRTTPETTATFEGTETILLVEDAEQLRRLAKHVLELSHYNVLDSRSPSHALEVARAHGGKIDLLLTDVVMPGMSGPEVAALLHLERPGVPVLYMSGYTDDAIVPHGVLDAGAHFIQKPFTPRALVRRVYETLNKPA